MGLFGIMLHVHVTVIICVPWKDAISNSQRKRGRWISLRNFRCAKNVVINDFKGAKVETPKPPKTLSKPKLISKNYRKCMQDHAHHELVKKHPYPTAPWLSGNLRKGSTPTIHPVHSYGTCEATSYGRHGGRHGHTLRWLEGLYHQVMLLWGSGPEKHLELVGGFSPPMGKNLSQVASFPNSLVVKTKNLLKPPPRGR